MYRGAFCEGFAEGYCALKEHPITEGVEKLYVCGLADGKVFGFTGLDAEEPIPILQIGYMNGGNTIHINTGDGALVTIVGVVEDGAGLVVMDGTGMVLGYNSFKGSSYDWPKMYRNILGYGSRSSN